MKTNSLLRVCKALSSPRRVAIVEFVLAHEPVTVRDVADALFGSPDRLLAVRRHLKILCDTELLMRVQIGREHLYTSTDGDVVIAAGSQLRALFGLSIKYTT